jgi:multicomponent Na+:H+ antiporter subunit G
MTEVAYYLGAAAIVLGALFSLLAAFGVLRLPDLFTRLHAASKAGVVGAGFILVGVMLVSFELAVALRALLGIVFLLLSTPVSAHLLARTAYRCGQKPLLPGNVDDMSSQAES